MAGVMPVPCGIRWACSFGGTRNRSADRLKPAARPRNRPPGAPFARQGGDRPEAVELPGDRRGGEGEPDRKGGALSLGAHDLDRAAVLLDDVARSGQPQPGAGDLVRHVAAAPKSLE